MIERTPIYLDHNATTPVDPRVLERMLPYFTEVFGNPASVEHVHGNRAQTAVKEARERVARALGARENEIIFTGSCTEANNLAILGTARARPEHRHIVTSAVEHPSVLEPCRALAAQGYELTILPVDADGRVSPDDVRASLRQDTLLVSIMAANNEVGTVQPVAEIGAICEASGTLFHSDLAQILSSRTVNVLAEHIHLASISGHKIYGPKGVGALYVRSRSPRARLNPLFFGGGQEKGVRPGTLNVPLIVGLSEAIDLAQRQCTHDAARLRAMTDEFRALVLANLNGVIFNGHPQDRLAGNISMSIEGVEPLALMHRLNPLASFSASSACSTEKVETSPVLLAMYGDTPRARQAFRVSPGRFTDKDDLLEFGAQLAVQAQALRQYAT